MCRMWTAAVANMLEGRFGFAAVTIGSPGPAEEEDVFDTLIAKLAAASQAIEIETRRYPQKRPEK
jgi:nitrogenase molybdenum-iron protein alpha/beta subunit